MTTVPQPGGVGSGLSLFRRRRAPSEQNWAFQGPALPRRGGCRASPRLRLLRGPDPGARDAALPGVKGSPGLSPSLSPPRAAVQLASSSSAPVPGPYWGPRPGAFCPSPETTELGWEAPKGLFHKDAARTLAKLQRGAKRASRQLEARENQKQESKGSGEREDAGAER